MKKVISILCLAIMVSCGKPYNWCLVTEVSKRGDYCLYECCSLLDDDKNEVQTHFVDHCNKFKVGDTLTFVKK